MKLSALVVLAVTGLAIAQHAPSTLPKVKFTDTRLDNGLRVIVSEDHYAPVYAICVAYKVGSKDERPGRTGFAHLFEHMMFKGTENVGVGELDFLIYTNGGNSNGTTNTDRTSYYEVLPKNQLDLGLYLEADRMHALAITPENLENQRQAVKEERRQSVDNQAYGQTSEKLEELVYDNFAYHHPVVGSMQDLDAASVDDVKQFFKTYYAPNNAVLALVGDLDTKETLAKVKKYFGAIPRETPPTLVNLAEAPKTAERRAVVQDPLARLQRIDIAYRIPPAGDADTRALGVAASILGGGGGGFGGRGGGGGNTSRLYNLLVQEKELAVQVSANADRRAGPGMFRISATIRQGKSAQEVEGLISEEISKLHSQPVSEQELKRVRMAVRRGAENRLTALSRAQALADAAAVYDDPNRINAELDAQLAVNAPDIMRAAKADLVNANKSVVITQPAPRSQQQ
ncbi:Peptidase M16 domain protein [Candidatus Sulfopaludibacter sp. SbA3]|nr:Peptidase M16 domain protein [Candidatus Sulfopaludibacter sp. SbA3]